MLRKEFHYYLEHQEELVKLYDGKHIVVKDQHVIGAYDSHAEAYHTSRKIHQEGTFLIQLCTPGPDAYTMTFYGSVAF